MDLDYTAEWKQALQQQFLSALRRGAPATLDALREIRPEDSAQRRAAVAAWAERYGLVAGGEPEWILEAAQNGLAADSASLGHGRPQAKPQHYFDWLVQSQVHGWSYQQIAAHGNGRSAVSCHAVRNRVQELRQALDLPQVTGGKRSKRRC